MSISDCLDINLISFLNADSRDDAISKMVGVLDRFDKLKDKELFKEAIMKREKIVSTGIGMQVAIPHAKLDQFHSFFIAIGIQKEKGLDWKSLDNSPVRIIFMIGGPDDKQYEYLQILSKITIIIKDEKIRKKLINAVSKEEVMHILSSY